MLGMRPLKRCAELLRPLALCWLCIMQASQAPHPGVPCPPVFHLASLRGASAACVLAHLSQRAGSLVLRCCLTCLEVRSHCVRAGSLVCVRAVSLVAACCLGELAFGGGRWEEEPGRGRRSMGVRRSLDIIFSSNYGPIKTSCRSGRRWLARVNSRSPRRDALCVLE